jgi:5'-nucleotidase
MKASVVLSALAGCAVADDVLYSRRLLKRGIDDEGHYNMCKASLHYSPI